MAPLPPGYAYVRNNRSFEFCFRSGPQDWDSLAPACGETAQSPIDIMTNAVVPDSNLGVLRLGGYNQQLNGGQFINNGHSGEAL